LAGGATTDLSKRPELRLTRLFGNSDIGTTLASLAEGLGVRLTVLDNEEKPIASWGADEPHKGAANHVVRLPVEVMDFRAGLVELQDGVLHSQDELQRLAEAVTGILRERLYLEYEIANIADELGEKYEEINLLYQLSESLGAVFDPRKVCEIALREAVQALRVRRASVMVYDKKIQKLRIYAAVGIPESVVEEVEVAPGEGISGYVFETGEPLLVEDVDSCAVVVDKLPDSRSYQTTSFVSVPVLCSPMRVKDERLGVMNLADKLDAKPFTSGDLKLLTAIASVTAISLYNSFLVQEVRETERLRKELEIANTIQTSLLPKRLPKIPGVDLAAVYRIAKKVGGDYYDFYTDETQLLSLVVADVSGHNIGAALMMVEARSVIRSEMSRWRDPAEILHGTNKVIFEDLEGGQLFVSAFCARLDPGSWLMEFANAGHCQPVWVDGKTGEIRRLDADGMLLGIWPEVVFEKKTIELGEGDVIFIFTDGASEARSPSGEQFGEERLAEIVAANRHLSAKEILDVVQDHLTAFTQTDKFSDDVTMMVLRRESGKKG